MVSTVANEDFCHFTSLITSISRLFAHFLKLHNFKDILCCVCFYIDVSETRYKVRFLSLNASFRSANLRKISKNKFANWTDCKVADDLPYFYP
jgi:hypothetical protein